jgi:hypothetical protein
MLPCLAGPPLQGKAAAAEPLYRRILQLDVQAVQPDTLESFLNLAKSLCSKVSACFQRGASSAGTAAAAACCRTAWAAHCPVLTPRPHLWFLSDNPKTPKTPENPALR